MHNFGNISKSEVSLMKFIKKFAKEISVFGLVLVVFLCLLAYRTATYATYKTISAAQLEKMIANEKDFILVAGTSSDSSMSSYQDVMTEFATKNRKYKIYYVNKNSAYVKKTLKKAVATPATFIIKDGKVKAYRSGALQYYYLKDFVQSNY